MPASQDQNAKLAKKASTRKVPPPVYEAPEPEEVPRREARLTAFYMSCDRLTTPGLAGPHATIATEPLSSPLVGQVVALSRFKQGPSRRDHSTR
jgi:hypothetical protein